MRFSLTSRIAAAFIVSLISLVTLATISYRNVVALNRDVEWVTHTFEVLQTKEALKRTRAEMEAGARGYIIAGDSMFREQALATSAELISTQRKLFELTADNPPQQARIDRFGALLLQRRALIERLIQLRADGTSPSDASVQQLVREGFEVGRSLGDLTAAIEVHEYELLTQRTAAAKAAAQRVSATLLYGSATSTLVMLAIVVWLLSSIRGPLRSLVAGAGQLARGEYGHRVPHTSRDEIGDLAAAFNQMAAQVEQRQVALAAEAWVKNSQARLSRVLEGQRELPALCDAVLSELAQLLEFQHGAIYLPPAEGERNRLLLHGTYAANDAPTSIAVGTGLVGQAFVERRRIQIDQLPDHYVRIGSALGQAPARHLLVFPIVLHGEVSAVLELASFQPFTELQLRLLEQIPDSLALALHTVIANKRTEQQRAELAERNDELEAQGQRLRASEEELQQQQEELKQSNEELEQTNEELRQANSEMDERSRLLEEQKRLLEATNLEIETARATLEEKSKLLALTSKYKSEFLANMSHELRTPLNSLLILSKLLAENTEGTLSDKQVQHARTIWNSGNDLLRLIDDILDLAKVEAGAIELELAEFPVRSLTESIEAVFRPIAQSRGLEFIVTLGPDLPATLSSDMHRLQQVLKNLLANAFKFTQRGSVELSIYPVTGGWDAAATALSQAKHVIAFAVKDTGIGIPEDRQKLIFEAFQQADAGTARKYGGTGLGLSISRELAGLLKGAISLHSTPGSGSTFTLFIPDTVEPAAQQKRPEPAVDMGRARTLVAPDRGEAAAAEMEADLMEDDRADIAEGDAVLLIVEDDRNFAYVLADCAREKSFKVVVAGTAHAAIALARRIKPTAITLDLHLPDSDGRVVLDLLKHDPATRHIPVHVISVAAEGERSLRQGAVSFLQKPVTREALNRALSVAAEFAASRMRRLLIVEDDPVQQQAIRDVIGNGDVETTVVGTAAAALQVLETTRFNCLVLDLGLPDQSGVDLIREIHRRHGLRSPPVIVYTAKALTRREETELRGLSEAIIVKDVRSPERLLDETALFLHRVQAKLPDAKRRMLERVQRDDALLAGRKVLVVDDDLRNIFAISTALENYKMVVSYAEGGREALDKLQQEDGYSAILMDVMMPEMDGYEVTRRIRAMPAYAKLPIIMVTAKAMRGDREKCLQAGASDYITKPVDMDQLRSLLRVWLYR
jgi:CheY-like chemotaxis protein/signal transduction histidine kinase/CHASE3 domain sensor protein